MSTIVAMALKDIRLLTRDRAGLLFTVVIPLVVAVFFGSVFGGGDGGSGPIDVVVVDEDRTPQSARMVEALQSNLDLEVVTADQDAAVDLVRRGERTAYIVIPAGFGQTQGSLFLGESPTLILGGDPSRRAQLGMLEGILIQAAIEGLQGLLSDSNQVHSYVQGAQAALTLDPFSDHSHTLRFLSELDTFVGEMNGVGDVSDNGHGEGSGDSGEGGMTWTPVNIETASIVADEDGPGSAFEISFPQGIIWALIACVATFAASLVQERTWGTLARLRSAPINSTHILAGKALACFLTSMVLSLLMLVVGVLFFGLWPASWSVVLLAILATSIAFVGIMMLLSVCGRTERAVSTIGWTVLMVMSMVGGGMMPLYFMPSWMQSVSQLSPVGWAIRGLEAGLWRGFSVVEVLPICGVLLGVGVASFAVGVGIFRRSEF